MFDIIDTVFDALKSFAGTIADAIGNEIMETLSNWIGLVMLFVTQRLCEILNALYSIFSIFAGITKVQMDGEYKYLFDVFFENSTISSVYWGMAMIGFVLLFGFVILSVLRKIFDLNDKRQSIGQILGGAFKSFLVIVSLTAILTFSVTLTNVLIQQVSYVFDQGSTLAKRQEIEFTDEQYATMARILNSIGNYSLNPGNTQRYNINTCYNEIRPDLLYLQQQGVFDLTYPEEDVNGNYNPTWQSALQKLILANNPEHELKIDPYYDQVSQAMVEIMNLIRLDAEFYPLEKFENQYASASTVPLDRVLFLSGTMDSARNNLYNREPGMDDGLRGAFYTGVKSIYSVDDVESAFNIGIGGINYLMIWFGWYWIVKNLVRCILSCAARVINVVGLYVVAPPVAASIPLDDGQKFKEWVTSMVIQMLGIFGSIIPMRLVLLFLPVVMDSKLVLLSSPVLNIFAKVVLLYGMMEAVGRFGGIITGILANSAGSAALMAANMDEKADKKFSRLGGKFLPFTTDVDDPNGDRKKAEKQRKDDKKEQEKKEKKAEKQQKQQAQSAGKSSGGVPGAVKTPPKGTPGSQSGTATKNNNSSGSTATKPATSTTPKNSTTSTTPKPATSTTPKNSTTSTTTKPATTSTTPKPATSTTTKPSAGTTMPTKANVPNTQKNSTTPPTQQKTVGQTNQSASTNGTNSANGTTESNSTLPENQLGMNGQPKFADASTQTEETTPTNQQPKFADASTQTDDPEPTSGQSSLFQGLNGNSTVSGNSFMEELAKKLGIDPNQANTEAPDLPANANTEQKKESGTPSKQEAYDNLFGKGQYEKNVAKKVVPPTFNDLPGNLSGKK